jgi:nitrate reductase NapE component
MAKKDRKVLGWILITVAFFIYFCFDPITAIIVLGGFGFLTILAYCFSE